MINLKTAVCLIVILLAFNVISGCGSSPPRANPEVENRAVLLSRQILSSNSPGAEGQAPVEVSFHVYVYAGSLDRSRDVFDSASVEDRPGSCPADKIHRHGRAQGCGSS